MEKYSRKSLRNIQKIVQDKTGVVITTNRKRARYKTRKMALLAGCLLCFVLLCAFTYIKFSELNGDVVGFASAYQGNGKFEIVVINYSDKELKLQDKVKVMQWSTSEEVEGNNEKIKISGLTIPSHSVGIVSIDIAQGYDVGAMKKNLQDGDWYYFILTNNNFVFGQDWMCSFDFQEQSIADAKHKLEEAKKQRKKKQDAGEQEYDTGNLVHSDWLWPTGSQRVSAFYGEQRNGAYSDHINIAGTVGEEIYAVADGVVVQIAFEHIYGNTIIVDLGDGIMVQYGHLQEIMVSEGDALQQGQVIATLGQTGMATGPNLLFSVTVNGEKINPLVEE